MRKKKGKGGEEEKKPSLQGLVETGETEKKKNRKTKQGPTNPFMFFNQKEKRQKKTTRKRTLFSSTTKIKNKRGAH